MKQRHDGEALRPQCERCERFYYSNPVPAACCIVTSGDSLLLVQRAVEPCRGEWTLPGGFVEVGETTEEAVLRELYEETGLHGQGLQLLGVSTQPSKMTGAVMVLGYRVLAWEGEPEARSDALAFGFFSKAERPPLAFQAHRDLLAIFDALELA